MARKGKYQEVAAQVVQFIEEGETDANACRLANINTDTFYEWLKKRPEFSDAIKTARENFLKNRQSQIERCLIARAKGGIKVKEISTEYIAGADGKPIIAKRVCKEKTLPPDTAALIFTLSNIAPETWKNKQATELTGKDGERLFEPLTIEVIDRREQVDEDSDNEGV